MSTAVVNGTKLYYEMAGHGRAIIFIHEPEVAACLEQMIGDYSGWHFVNDNPEMGLERPSASRLSELTMPVLAIVGELDLPDFRRMTDLIGDQLPQARRVVVPGVGHMANMEAPEAVLQVITDFLSGFDE